MPRAGLWPTHGAGTATPGAPGLAPEHKWRYIYIMAESTGGRPLDEMLSKREQQVMELLHRRGRASAADLCDAVPDIPSYDAMRSVLRLLEEKGRIRHEREGRRYIYRPSQPAHRAGRQALERVAQTFFGGSPADLVNALFDAEEPSREELDRLQELIDAAREADSS